MSRQFNPDLFKPENVPSQDVTGAALSQIEGMKRRMRELELQNHQLLQKIDKMALFYEQKISQITAQQKTSESNIRQNLAELAKNQTAVSQRLTERKAVDLKMQELIDRHNLLVQNFESKMTHVQKVTKEQELKLLTYQTTLNEILREIRSLQK